MRLSAVTFTAAGDRLADRLLAGIRGHGYDISELLHMHGSEKCASLSKWTRAAFERDDGIIFIGACGIAVRSVAPCLRDKHYDPAVVVIDERGQFAISLLSGHIGGANSLALTVADILGATPVITTATDINGRFAVDLWAQRQQCIIGDADIAREISAAILSGGFVGMCGDFPLVGTPPLGITQSDAGGLGIYVSYDEKKHPFAHTLSAIPRRLTLGIGCRRGISSGAIGCAVASALEECHISFWAVASVASIDLKSDEPGLREFCEKYSLPLRFFSARELAAVEGNFTASDFVSEITGVDNVCERSAVAALGCEGRMIVKKFAQDGVTVAVAAPDFTVTFEY